MGESAQNVPAMAQRDEDLGARVRAARSYAGLSQSGLADAIGVERRIVTYIEANDSRHPLSVREARRIAGATGVPVGFLLNGWDGTAGLAERIDALEDDVRQSQVERAALKQALAAIGTLLRDRLGLDVEEASAPDLGLADEDDHPQEEDPPAP